MDILVSGSLAIDRIMTYNGRFGDHIVPERVHQINVSFTVDGFHAYFGGTAGNIAYSLAMLGQRPRLIAAIGHDYRDYFDWMHTNGISTEDIRIIDEEATASAFITTDLSDNQITGFNPGAMKFPAGFDFGKVDAAETINIVAPGNLTDMADFSEQGTRSGIYTIFDPGQSLPAWDADGLVAGIGNSNLLIANDYEMAMIEEKTGIDETGLLGLTEALVITLGEQGVRIVTPDGSLTVPCVKTESVVDPTGAGDAFRGGLIKGLIQNDSLERCAQIGSACAHFAIQKPGTQEYGYSLDELNAVLRHAYGG
jgi:adenosine kinase